ncbi:MAG: hypothetical protein K0Q89_55 [Thermomicrobiales bacterium]|jgi:hypothetical protein|nr:hypothetical protein [Thermomicrobiales bacterium]
MATRKFPVDLTLKQINDVAKVISDAHLDKQWQAEKNLAEAAAEDEARVAETGNTYDAYRVRSILDARVEQQRLSDLHEAVTGDPLEATPEKAPKPVDVDA